MVTTTRCLTQNSCCGSGSTTWGQIHPREGFLEDFQAELWTCELLASPPTPEPARLQLTLTSSAPRSCHRRFPSATSPLGPGGAGRTSWSLGCLDMPTTAGTGNAGPSGAPPATRKANLISLNPWAALICLHWRFDGGQEGFATH